MATTYRIAVIGSWESVMGFRALGLETYPVTAPEEARETIRELAKSGGKTAPCGRARSGRDPENSQVSSVYLAALPRAFSTGYLAAF